MPTRESIFHYVYRLDTHITPETGGQTRENSASIPFCLTKGEDMSWLQKSMCWLSLCVCCCLWTACQKDIQDTDELARQRHSILRRHPNKKPARVILMRPVQYRGVALMGRQNVRFYPNGQLRSGRLAHMQTLQGVAVRGKSQVQFAKNGRLISAFLARPQSFSGIRLPQGSLVRFSTKGSLLGYTHATSHRSVLLKAGKPLPCHPQRLILLGRKDSWGCLLTKPVKWGAFSLAAGHMSWFDASGNPLQITLAAPIKWKQKTYHKGDTMVFTKDSVKSLRSQKHPSHPPASTRPTARR